MAPSSNSAWKRASPSAVRVASRAASSNRWFTTADDTEQRDLTLRYRVRPMRTAGLFTVVVVVAAVDWWAVARDRRRLELLAKPLTLVALIIATGILLGVEEPAHRWLLVGLLLSLAGDALLLSHHPTAFVTGLAAFLGAHLAYIVAFLLAGTGGPGAVAGLAVVAVLVATLGRRILAAVRQTEPAMTGPVAAYVVAISGMVVAALGRGSWTAAVGALLFYLSDALIAWNRFVRPIRRGRLAIMTTYHAGQMLIVASFL